MSALIFKDDSFLILPYWPNPFSCGLLVMIYKPIVDLRYLLTEAMLGKRKTVPFSTTVVYNGICLYWSWCVRETRNRMSQTSFNKYISYEPIRDWPNKKKVPYKAASGAV